MKTELLGKKVGVMLDNAIKIKQAFENPQWYLDGTAFNIRLRAETIREFTHNREYASILDIGCGDGSLSSQLLTEKNCLTLVDQSKAMLEIARSRIPRGLSSRVNCMNAGFMESGLDTQCFDLIICVGVLAYVKQRRDFILKIKSLLKPGGSVIIECSDANHFLSYWIRTYQSLVRIIKPSRVETVNGASSEILAIFANLGFKCRRSYRYSTPPPPFSKILSQKLSYSLVRGINGTSERNRNAWWGRECLYLLEKDGN